MEKFLFENDIDSMRARELRNLLVQKLGVDPDLISRIIDRNELKEMVTAIFHDRVQQKAQAEFTHNMLIATAVVGALTVIYLCRNMIARFVMSIYSMLGENSYKSAKKAKLMMFNARRGKYLGALALGVSLLLEIAIMQMQISTLLSWFVARDHPVRRYMLPMLSFPVSANTLIKAGTGGKRGLPSNPQGSLGAAVSNFSLDVGPMLTIAALNFIVGKLDEYAAGIVLDHVKTRDDKKATKKFAKAFGMKKPASASTPAGDGVSSTENRSDPAATAGADKDEYVFEDVAADEGEEGFNAQMPAAKQVPKHVPQSRMKPGKYSAATLRAMAENSPYASVAPSASKAAGAVGEEVPLEFDASLESYMNDESDWLGQQSSGNIQGSTGTTTEGGGSPQRQQYESEWLD